MGTKKKKQATKPKVWSPTVKQQKFIDYYEGNATEAAIKAGYSKKTAKSQGQRLLTNVALFALIEKRLEVEKSVLIADRQEREERLSEILRNDRVYIHINQKTSQETIEVEVENRDVIKAIETLNKMDGIYVQKHQVTDGDGKPLKLSLEVTFVESKSGESKN